MIDLNKIIVLIVLIFIILSLYKEFFRPVATFLIGIIVLMLFKILSPKDVLSGFANEQIAVIFLLLVISDIIKNTGVLDVSLSKIFKPGLSYKGFLSRMYFSVSFTSAWVNNTPLVAIMLPYVYNWAKKNKISPSKVLIPLSYAAILGGKVTLVGTSTNLLVNGMAMEANLKPLLMFDFIYVGIPLVIFGGIYILLWGHKLLPDRRDAMSDFEDKSREYIVETLIPETSTFISKTVEEANLRNLKGLFLVEIIRDEKKIVPVSPNDVLQKDDILIFAGAIDTIVDLVRNTKDLSLPSPSKLPSTEKLSVTEIVISSRSNLIGQKVKDTNFRGKYDGAIVAINRDGERLSGKIGEIEIKIGDLLLLITGSDFDKRIENTRNFHSISYPKQYHNFNKNKIRLILISTLVAFVCAGFGLISLFTALIILIGGFAFLKIIKLNEIKNSLDIQLLFMLVLSLAFGKAIDTSGLAKVFSEYIITIAHPFESPVFVLLAIYLITLILANLITAAAAAAIVFPVAAATSLQLGLDTHSFILAIAFAASSAFMNPFAYQTHLLVFGAGGYKFKDFIPIGFWLTLIYMITTISILGFMYNLF